MIYTSEEFKKYFSQFDFYVILNLILKYEQTTLNLHITLYDFLISSSTPVL